MNDMHVAGSPAPHTGRSKQKVRMELARDIEPAELYGITNLVGDILVDEYVTSDGEIEPKTYHLLRVRSR